MVSDSRPEGRQNTNDNVFQGLHVGTEESGLVAKYLAAHDFAEHTRKAILSDLRKFVRWFNEANREPFIVGRVTLRDVTDFRSYLSREKRQAVASVNRALVVIRKFCGWLVTEGKLLSNPAKQVKELRRQPLAPKGLERSEVRKLLREIELRQDIRAVAIFSFILYTGCRVSDLVNLELGDLLIGERAGSVIFRHGKGGKQRSVPLPLPARMALQEYLAVRPPVDSPNVFIGERGAITSDGVRFLCRKYSAIVGVRIHPHVLRHTMAKQFLADTGNDLVSLAQILGHENLQTTSRYSQRNAAQLEQAVSQLIY
jgi:integrase/recombinase XerC